MRSHGSLDGRILPDAAGDVADAETASADPEFEVEPPAGFDPEQVFGEFEFPFQDRAVVELALDGVPNGKANVAGELAAVGVPLVVPGLESIRPGLAEGEFSLIHAGADPYWGSVIRPRKRRSPEMAGPRWQARQVGGTLTLPPKLVGRGSVEPVLKSQVFRFKFQILKLETWDSQTAREDTRPTPR